MIIAAITVYCCDDCNEITVLQSAEEEQTFQADWFTSLTKDFCPTCKDKVKNLAAIDAAEQLDQSAFIMLDAPASAEEAKCH